MKYHVQDKILVCINTNTGIINTSLQTIELLYRSLDILITESLIILIYVFLDKTVIYDNHKCKRLDLQLDCLCIKTISARPVIFQTNKYEAEIH